MKCILTVAGLGTRLLPLTKELPKEMLPVYSNSKKGNLILKPIIQVIFESLYQYNIKDFCFIVGRTKKSVEKHFTPDKNLIKILNDAKKNKLAQILLEFFLKLEKSTIVFTQQPKPIGFGDAIFRGKGFVTKEKYFLLHAGDDIVISNKNKHLKRLENSFKKYNAEIAFLVEKVKNPTQYGVIEGTLLEKGVIDVKKMVEKPKRPHSNLAIIAVYIFKPKIFNYLSQAKKKSSSEKQLATAFNIALKKKARIIGVILENDEKRIDVGTPENYARFLLSSKSSIN